MLIEANAGKLQARMDAVGLSSREACRRCGWAVAQWIRWKKGYLKTGPRLDRVVALNLEIERHERAALVLAGLTSGGFGVPDAMLDEEERREGHGQRQRADCTDTTGRPIDIGSGCVARRDRAGVKVGAG